MDECMNIGYIRDFITKLDLLKSKRDVNVVRGGLYLGAGAQNARACGGGATLLDQGRRMLVLVGGGATPWSRGAECLC
jgi:hypothetical protein